MEPSKVTASQGSKLGHILIHNVRIAFAHGLWTAQQVQGQGRPAFSSSFIIPPQAPALNVLYQVMQQVANDKWGQQGDEVLKALFAGGRVCLRDGNSKPDVAGYPGNWFISSRSPTRPLVIDQSRNPIDQSSGLVYSGAYVNANLAIWAQQNQHGRRVNAQLRGVQLVADGEPLAGGSPADVEEFGEVEASAQPAAEFGAQLGSGPAQGPAPGGDLADLIGTPSSS